MRGFLKRLLFPTVCPVCGDASCASAVEERGICDSCFSKYANSAEHSLIEMPTFAPSCIAAYCPLYYGGELRDTLKNYKFGGETYIGECLGKVLYFSGNDLGLFNNIDVITAVPLSDERLAERGFNQSGEIASCVASLAGLPFEELLERSIQGEAQSRLLTDERHKTGSKFDLKEDADVSGKSILLIDDIITTGSTVDACARLLLEGGATGVIAAAPVSGRKEFV